MSAGNLILAIIMMALVTFGQKIIPFVILKALKNSKGMAYLAERLPPAVMLILVTYALRTQWEGFSNVSLVPILASLFTAVIHVLLRQVLISITVGVLIFSVLKILLLTIIKFTCRIEWCKTIISKIKFPFQKLFFN